MHISNHFSFLFDEKRKSLLVSGLETDKGNQCLFILKFNCFLLVDEVDEEIHGCDTAELASRHVVKFVATFELLFSNYDDIRDDQDYSRMMMNPNHY